MSKTVGRPPDPKSKQNQIIIRARNEEEATRIRAFKEVCLRDGLEVKSEILGKIDLFLREHNWPPGNPQKPLTEFTESLIEEEVKPSFIVLDVEKLSVRQLKNRVKREINSVTRYRIEKELARRGKE